MCERILSIGTSNSTSSRDSSPTRNADPVGRAVRAFAARSSHMRARVIDVSANSCVTSPFFPSTPRDHRKPAMQCVASDQSNRMRNRRDAASAHRGRVHDAEQLVAQREVALKRLVERFVGRIRIVSRLSSRMIASCPGATSTW